MQKNRLALVSLSVGSYSSLLFKCLLIFSLIFSSLSTVIPNYAYADETKEEAKKDDKKDNKDEDEEEGVGTSDDDGSENAFSGLDVGRQEIILNRLTYDERLHYIITYAIISDSYFGKGAYTELTNRGRFPVDHEKGISIPNFNTGGSSMALSSVVGENSDEQESANVENSSKNKVEKSAETLASELTKKYAKRLAEIQSELIETTAMKVKNNANLDAFNLFGKGIQVVAQKEGKETISSGKNPERLNNLLGKKNKGAQNLLKRYERNMANKFIGTKFTGKKFERKTLYTMMLSMDDYLAVNSSVESSFVSNFQFHNIKFEEEEGYGYLPLQYPVSHTKFTLKEGVELDDFVAYSHLLPYEFKANMVKSSYKEIKRDYSSFNEYLRYKENIKGNSHVKDKITALIEEINKDELFKRLQSAQQNSLDVSSDTIENSKKGDVRGIGWLPLTFKYNFEESTAKSVQKVMELFDGGKLQEDGSVILSSSTKYEGRRLLQVNDLVNIPVTKAGFGEKSKKRRASPYLGMEYETVTSMKDDNDRKTRLKIGKSDKELVPHIVYYTGVKVTEKDESKKTLFGKAKDFFLESDVDKYGMTTAIEDADQTHHKYVGQRAISYVNRNSESVTDFTKVGDLVVGQDNYGNVISAESMQVIIPYWNNTMIPEIKSLHKSGSKEFMTTPSMKKLDKNVINNIVGGNLTETELDVVLSEKNFSTMKFDEGKIDALNNILASGKMERSKFSTYTSIIEESEGKQAIALAITMRTQSAVKKYNKQFLTIAKDTSEVYLTPSKAGSADYNDAESDLDKFDALALLEKIQLILDVGFYELIRLTIASWVVAFYTGAISNFSLASIFHTQLISDTPIWSDILVFLAMLLVSFTAIHLVILGMKLMRQTITARDFIRQFAVLIVVLLIPTVIYSPIINLALNKPTQLIIQKQMEQISMVDTFLEKQKEYTEVDPLYEKLFKHSIDARSRDEDYLVDFYTTEHINGFDITSADVKKVQSFKNKFVRDNLNSDGDYKLSELVKIRVSIFDLFEWVESDSNDLFSWLSANKSDKYEGIGKYTEYSHSTEVNNETLNFHFGGKMWKASEIYKHLHDSMLENKVNNNITSLYKITDAFKTRKSADQTEGMSRAEREILVRDLSFTGEVRKSLYGKENEVSEKTKEIFARYKIDSNTVNLTTDFLSLEEPVKMFKPYRNITTTTIAGDTFDINKKIIDDYIINLSVVRESVEASDDIYSKAEYAMIVLRTWFEFNDYLGNKFFPTKYGVDTISFDSYMRLIYIPIGQYFEVDTPDIKNVSEYLSLREHPGTLLFLFLPFILVLVIFGLLYLAVFYVLLMLLMMGAFIYNKVLHDNKEDKALFGAIMIILSFGLVKFGLVALWSFLATIMNHSYVTHDGGVNYPVAIVHSLALFVYTVLGLIFLWKKVISKVLRDKANLGGQEMQDDMKESFGKLQAKITGMITGVQTNTGGINRLSGDNSTPSAFDKLGKKGMNPNKFTLNRNKKYSPRANKAMMNSLMNTNAMQSASAIATTLATKATTQGINKLDGVYNLTQPNGKPIQMVKNASEMLLNAVPTNRKTMRANKKMLKEYDKIAPESIVGLSKEERHSLEETRAYGKDVTKDQNEYLTLNTNSEKASEFLTKTMEQMGIEVSRDDEGKVTMKVNDYDLSKASHRKALFGAVIEQSAKTLSSLDNNYSIMHSSDALNYITNEDGTVSVGVGKDGLSQKNLDSVLQSPHIQDNFIIESLPEMTSKGYAIGQAILRPRNGDVNIDDSMQNVFQQDTLVREEYNEAPRKATPLSSKINLTGQPKEKIEQIKEEMPQGMSMQNNQLFFDARNSSHESYAKKLSNVLTESLIEEQQAYQNLGIQLASHVQKGEGYGIESKTFKSSDVTSDKKEVERLREQGHDVYDMSSNVSYFGGKHVNEIAKRVKDTMAFSKLDPELAKNFSSTQATIRQQGEEIIAQLTKKKGMTEVAHDRAQLQQLTTLAEKSNVDSNVVDSIKKEQRTLEKKRKDNKISESEYEKGMKSLVGKAKERLSRDDKYMNVMTDVLRNSISKGNMGKDTSDAIRKSLDDYVNTHRTLEKEGVKDIGSSIALYEELNLDKYGVNLNSVKDISVSSDGKVNIKTDGTIEKESLNRMMVDIARSIDNTKGF